MSNTVTATERVASIVRNLPYVNVMTLDECREYINESVPFLLDERDRFRDELKRIAAWEPAHRDRINALLNGGAE